MMRTNLWVSIVFVAAFLGFMIGYSVPPLLEVGMLGGGGEAPKAQDDVSEEMQDYYKELSKDD